MLDTASSTVSDQKLYYDGLSFGRVTLGNNTRQEDWISGSTFASSTKTYNSYGLVATSTDRRGYATGYKYDAFNLYVATATNPLNQQTQFMYNYANGKPKLVTDPNNRLTKNLYDGVGRLIEVGSIRRLQSAPVIDYDHLPIHGQHHSALDHSPHRLPDCNQHRRHL